MRLLRRELRPSPPAARAQSVDMPEPSLAILLSVDFAAQVWVNGQLAVTHERGHTDTVCAEQRAVSDLR